MFSSFAQSSYKKFNDIICLNICPWFSMKDEMKTWRKEKLDLENQVLKLNKQVKEKKGDDDEKDEIIAGIES